MLNPLAHDLDHILSHTADVWSELRGRRVFITGGTGFFGAWLLESFAWANDHLRLDSHAVVLTRDAGRFHEKAPRLAAHPAIEFHEGDIRDFDFPRGEFSHVIHAAAESTSGLNERDPGEMLDSIVAGTRRALAFTVACGARKFLLTSSGVVYGRQPAEVNRVPETYAGAPDLANPRSAYAEGKRAAELLCSIYHQRHGVETKIARCFAFTGPYLPLDVHFAVGNFIGDCLHGRPIEIRGDGTPRRSYLYAADLAIWLWTILARGQAQLPYNVGSERDLSIAELAGTVSAVLDSHQPIKIATPAAPRAPERYVPDTGRARRDLHLSEWIPLEDAISRTAEWHRTVIQAPLHEEATA